MGEVEVEETITGLSGANMFELQDRTEHHIQMIQSCGQRMEQAKRAAKIAALSHQEIETYGQVKTYPALGRAFVFRPLEASLKLLEDEAEANLEAVKKVEPEIRFHEERLKAVQAELAEIMGEKKKGSAGAAAAGDD